MDRSELIKSLGLTLSAQFVPQSQSRNKGEKYRSLNWLVTVKSPRGEIVTDYMQGIGHVPGYSQKDMIPTGRTRRIVTPSQQRPARLVWYYNEIAVVAEKGTYIPNLNYNRATSAGEPARSPLPAPTLEAVLYSLISDAAAWSMTFEEWCGELSYDTDSRKAHAMYMACSDIGVRLVRMVGGHENLAKLQEAFQDF